MNSIFEYLKGIWQALHGKAVSIQGGFSKADLRLVLEASGHDLEELTKDARARGKELVYNANDSIRRANKSVEDEEEALRRALASARATKKKASRQRFQGQRYLSAVRNLGAK